MSFAKAIRSHREQNRSRRALERAISNAASPSMRDDLVMVAQRSEMLTRQYH